MAAVTRFHLYHPEIGVELRLPGNEGVGLGLRHGISTGGAEPSPVAVQIHRALEHGAADAMLVELDEHGAGRVVAVADDDGRDIPRLADADVGLDPEAGAEARLAQSSTSQSFWTCGAPSTTPPRRGSTAATCGVWRCASRSASVL